jgi:hypothetical protein
MYRKTKFLEVLQDIREEMSREADYDVLTLTEIARVGRTDGAKAPGRRNSEGLEEDKQSFKNRRPKTEDPNLVYGNRI